MHWRTCRHPVERRRFLGGSCDSGKPLPWVPRCPLSVNMGWICWVLRSRSNQITTARHRCRAPIRNQQPRPEACWCDVAKQVKLGLRECPFRSRPRKCLGWLVDQAPEDCGSRLRFSEKSTHFVTSWGENPAISTKRMKLILWTKVLCTNIG